jgi:hypothetical protein
VISNDTVKKLTELKPLGIGGGISQATLLAVVVYPGCKMSSAFCFLARLRWYRKFRGQASYLTVALPRISG